MMDKIVINTYFYWSWCYKLWLQSCLQNVKFYRISREKGERFRVRKSLAKNARASFFLMGSFYRRSLRTDWLPRVIFWLCRHPACYVSSSDCADTLLLRVKSWLADGDLCRVASKSPGGSHACLMWVLWWWCLGCLYRYALYNYFVPVTNIENRKENNL